jgi:hypothetical protein
VSADWDKVISVSADWDKEIAGSLLCYPFSWLHHEYEK